jgi:hypothetical protein
MKGLRHSIQRYWEILALVGIMLVTRLYLLRVYDVELSQDGFEAVRTLTIWQTQGLAALPRDLLDRALLHPLYMLVLGVWRVLIPAQFDFYLAARFLSTLFACVAVVVLFCFTRETFGRLAAWCAALFLVFAPSFLWESIAILSSTLFLTLYLAVLLALLRARYTLAFGLGWLAALVRYEGVVLIALTFVALLIRDARARQFRWNDWLIGGGAVLAFPLTLVIGSVLATGNPLQFIGAQSMASIWLRFLAPGDFFKRAAFFITQYPALFPAPIVWLGLGGILIALIAYRLRATMLLMLVAVLYVIFFQVLVFFNYTTLETRFLMYPGLPLLVFAGVTLSFLWSLFDRFQVSRLASKVARFSFFVLLFVLLVQSYQQGERGLRFVYNSQISMREMAAEIASIFPRHQRVNVLAYGGNSGALAMFARQYGIELEFTEFRFAPDHNPEQYIVDHQIQFVIYPIGNAFAKAKYPYLSKFEPQTHNGVTFQPIVQFATSADNQLYSIWSVTIHEPPD